MSVALVNRHGASNSKVSSQEFAWVTDAYQKWITRTLQLQIHDQSEDRGAFVDKPGQWHHGRHTGFALGHLLAARCLSADWSVTNSVFDQAVVDALAFILRRQAPDGRMDLGGIYSANEVGFTLSSLATAYRLLPVHTPNLFDRIHEDLKIYLLRGADAVVNGMAYTANHRWAAAAGPLAAVHRIFPDARYMDCIQGYLSDGIDCDAEGFWDIERSPNYNDVANTGMIILADALDRPELLDHVRRNMALMIHQVQPNSEADCSYSHRQDRHQSDRPVTGYLVPRRMACLTGDGRLTTLALMARMHLCQDLYPVPFELLEHPGTMPESQPLPEHYQIDYSDMQMMRRRKGKTALTLHADSGGHFFDTVRDDWGGIRRSEDWLHLHHGPIVIQSIRLQLAQEMAVMPSKLSRMNEYQYELSGQSQGWNHVLHFRPGSPVHLMKCRQSHTIDVTLLEDGLRIHIQCHSWDYLYGALNIYVRHGVKVGQTILQAGQVLPLPGREDVLLSEDDCSMKISGLPQADFMSEGSFQSSLPDKLEESCACLSLGLRMPVNVQMLLTWDS